MLSQALMELEEKAKAMAEELSTIRNYVEQLERQNASMQEIIKKKNQSLSGEGALLALFEAGFHICPPQYGEARDGDCIFCQAFLAKKE